MNRSLRYLIVISSGMLAMLPAIATAAPIQNRGLAITPLRQFISLNADTQKTDSFTVSNLTSGPLTVQLFDRQFSVADYTYDYRFNVPRPDLLTLSVSQVTLNAGQSQKVNYTVIVPPSATPGGQYYTLFASATAPDNNDVTVQAATLLYLTVNGALTTTTALHSSSVQHVSLGQQINYNLNPVDTGNVHYFIYVSGQLHGLFTKPAEQEQAHILLPGAIRSISGSIDAPILPGIYKATYGYRTDSGQSISRMSYVVYVPPWSIALVLLILLIAWNVRSRRNAKKQPTDTTEVSP